MSTPLPTKPIQRATVFIPGDPSVGIPHTSFHLEMYLDLTAYGNDKPETVLENCRNLIWELYEHISGEEPRVMFDFEIAAMNRQEEEATRDMP